MATYKEIKGATVQTRDEDPVVGGIAGATWSSGGALNTGRGLMGNGIGTQTAAAVVAGFNPPNTYYANTEEYDGSSWTESGDLPSARYQGMAGGTQNAGIYAGGFGGSWPALSATLYYNGTSWSDQSANLNQSRDSLKGTGIQTAALACGGISGPGSPADDETETWNGSAWTEVSELNTARYNHNVAGISTDAIAGPGTAPPGYAAAVETWNGSSWTEATEISTSRNNYGRTNYAAGGASTGALIFGGQSQPSGSPATLAVNEFWNGSSWTEVADLGTGRSRLAGAGTTTAALAVGAYPNTNNSATEEFSAAPVTAAILTEGSIFLSGGTTLKGFGKAAGIPSATWASGGSLNTARSENFGNGVGTQTAAGIAGGYTTANVGIHEQYDGTSWTETTDLNTARGGTWADGTQSASWIAAGVAPSYVTNTETWNGSAWTEVNEVNTARAFGGGTCGRSSTVGLVVAGYTGTANTGVVEQWDGTNWTEVGDLNSARRKAGGFGTSTLAFAIGAAPSPGNPGLNDKVESWDGSSWTETTEINTGRGAVGGAGVTTSGLIFGSEQTPRQITEAWNGTAWSEVNDMGVNQGNSAGAGGSAISAFIAGGNNGSTNVANTEEFTADAGLANVTVS